MVVNQKAVKVINKIFEAGITEEKRYFCNDLGRDSGDSGHHGCRDWNDQ